MMGFQGAVFHGGRNVVNSVQLRALPGPRAAFHAARGSVIAATRGMRDAILRHYGVESEVICEVGPPDVPPGEPPIRQAGRSARHFV